MCRYQERLQTIHKITDMKLMSSFEEFSENVMHPLEMSSAQPVPTAASSSRKASPTRILSSFMSVPSIVHRLHHHKSPSPHSLSSQSSHSPKTMTMSLSSFLKIPTLKDRVVDRFSPPARRQRSSTNDDRIQASPKCKSMTNSHSHPLCTPHAFPTVSEIRRNSSVPDLSDIEKMSVQDPKSNSDSNKLLDMRAQLPL